MSQTVGMPINKVLVTEDRAFVTRRLELELESGSHRLLLEKVSPILVDKSLLSRVESGHATVHDTRVKRRCRNNDEFDSPLASELKLKIKAADRESTSTQAEIQSHEIEFKLLTEILNRWLHDTAEALIWDQGDGKEWTGNFQQLQFRYRELTRDLTVLRSKVIHERQIVSDLQDQLNNATTRSDEVQAHLELDLSVSESGPLVLEIEYCVPGACWRPSHVATLGETDISVKSQACVWQNTGEDWTNVSLAFSTQRASLGTTAPPLGRDVVTLQKKAKTVVLQTTEESVEVLHKTGSKMPGIDDGGEVLRLTAAEAMNIKSDGKPHKVDLFSFQSTQDMEQILTAELSECVFRRSKQKNESSFPLLAGPVELVKASGLVGQSLVEFTAPGQEFFLSWGPQRALSVSREHKKFTEESSKLSAWKSREHCIELHLSNLGSDTQEFKVTERIPISELKQLIIEQDIENTTDSVEPDGSGFVSWEVLLEPKEVRKLELTYTVQKKKSVEGDI